MSGVLRLVLGDQLTRSLSRTAFGGLAIFLPLKTWPKFSSTKPPYCRMSLLNLAISATHLTFLEYLFVVASVTWRNRCWISASGRLPSAASQLAPPCLTWYG